MEANVRALTWEELAGVCTNLQKACSKQQRTEEAQLFGELAAFYEKQREPAVGATYEDLIASITLDVNTHYPAANSDAKKAADRGAQRALVWGEKATKLVKSLLERYERTGGALTEKTGLHVCEICGFPYVGDTPPSICPICKVPNFKIHPVKKEAL